MPLTLLIRRVLGTCSLIDGTFEVHSEGRGLLCLVNFIVGGPEFEDVFLSSADG